MFGLPFLSASTGRIQIFCVLFSLVLLQGLQAQTPFTYQASPAAFQDGDTIDLAYSVSSEGAIHQITFTHALQSWQVSEGFAPSIDVSNSWFCPDQRCVFEIDPSSANDSIKVIVTRPITDPKAGNGEMLRLKGIEVVIDDVWLRKSFEAEMSASVFPNPATEYVFVEITDPEIEAVVVLRDMLGRVVWEKEMTTGLRKFSVANVPTGFYQLSLMAGGVNLKSFPVLIQQ